LKCTEDPNGNVLQLRYQSGNGGQLELVEDSSERQLRFEYELQGEVNKVVRLSKISRLDYELTYGYDAFARLASSSMTSEYGTTTYEYDRFSLIEKIAQRLSGT
jgi:hypothetical protein